MSLRSLFILVMLSIFVLPERTNALGEFPELKGPYLGQIPPGLQAKIFAPGVITTEMHDDAAPVFSSDGREVYFRIVYKKNGKYFSPIFWMRECGGRWSVPEVAPFSGEYIDGCVTFFPRSSNDSTPGTVSRPAAGERMIFCSNRGASEAEPYNIDFWEITKPYLADAGEGAIEKDGPSPWGIPAKIDVLNTSGGELYPCFASNDLLYWMVEAGTNDHNPGRFISRFSDKGFATPESVDYFPGLDHLHYVFAFAPDFSYAVLMIDDGINNGDFFVSFKEEDGRWGEPVDLGPDVNSEAMEKAAYISPDGKYLFFVSNRRTAESNPLKYWDSSLFEGQQEISGADIYWVSTGIVEKHRTGKSD